MCFSSKVRRPSIRHFLLDHHTGMLQHTLTMHWNGEVVASSCTTHTGIPSMDQAQTHGIMTLLMAGSMVLMVA